MSFLNSLPLGRLLWLVPIFFTFHNLEEPAFMGGWSNSLPLIFHRIKSTKQFAIAVMVLTLAGFLITYLGVEKLERPFGYLPVLAVQMTLGFNVLVPTCFRRSIFEVTAPGL